MKTLYIHMPFCERKCFYCSFVISVGQEHQVDAYLRALDMEARKYEKEKTQNVYIGGGTPSLLDLKQLEELFRIIKARFVVARDAEWTIEANPEHLDREKLTCLKRHGINRVSLGVQTFHDGYLKYLGRNHTARTALEAYRKIRQAGFDNVNVDLMLAFPDQTMEELGRDMDACLSLESDHISLYTLTIEPNSRFYARGVRLGDEQDQARQYGYVCDRLARAGFTQYEVSNFAAAGKMSKHNMNYWQGGHYIGLGLGAHSYIGKRRFWNCARLHDYMARFTSGASVEEGHEELAPPDQLNEVILFGLRMNRGVHVERAEERFGCRLRGAQTEAIKQFCRNGLLEREDGYLKATPRGRLVLDEICTRLL